MDVDDRADHRRIGHVADVGKEIFDLIKATAAGQPTKSEETLEVGRGLGGEQGFEAQG